MNCSEISNLKSQISKLTAILTICLLITAGCKKKEMPAAPPPAAAEANATAAAEIEQTICPVMKAPIDKNIFVEYQGKKVYFCCGQCKREFEKNPEKYLSELPQFQK